MTCITIPITVTDSDRGAGIVPVVQKILIVGLWLSCYKNYGDLLPSWAGEFLLTLFTQVDSSLTAGLIVKMERLKQKGGTWPLVVQLCVALVRQVCITVRS